MKDVLVSVSVSVLITGKNERRFGFSLRFHYTAVQSLAVLDRDMKYNLLSTFTMEVR